jgi:hypothetical protein
MLYLCEDVGVASCSSHILCSYNLTLGSISSVYPDSVNGQDILLIISSSSFRPIPSSFVTSLHSGMILDNKVPTPSHPEEEEGEKANQCSQHPRGHPPRPEPAGKGEGEGLAGHQRGQPRVQGQVNDDDLPFMSACIPRHAAFYPQNGPLACWQ